MGSTAGESRGTVGFVNEASLFAQKVAVGVVLDGAQDVLARANIAVVALKGAWLLTEVYPAEILRPTKDVDLLVREEDFDAALDAFRRAGFSVLEIDWREVVLRHSDLPLPIDLHRAVFPRHTFALENFLVFGRSRPSRWTMVRFPDPLDGIASVVGHFAINRDVEENLAREEDLQRIAERFEVSPTACTARLSEVGMGRAARYVMETLIACGRTPQTFCEAALASLPRDPMGQAIVRLCRNAIPKIPAQQRLGALFCCLLERDLAHAVLSGASRTRDVLTNRLFRQP